MSEDEHLGNSPEQSAPDDKPWRWKPGQSGNPSGRPKGSRSLTALLRELLESETSDIAGPDGKPMKWGELLVRMTLKNACKGNGTCMKEVFERMDGKVPERVLAEYGPNWELVFDTPASEATPERQDGAQ